MTAGLPGPVRAVTFDLDFTLWDLTGVIELAERRADEWLQARFPAVAERYDREALRVLRLELADQRPALRHDVTALRRAAFAAAGERCGLAEADREALVHGAYEAFIAGRHEVVIYEDTRPLLEWLHGRVPIGAITNGNADIGRLSLGPYFDFSVSAMDVGAAKPSHLVFEAACGRAGVPAGAIVHVGDDCECDVVGSYRAGMQPVWLDRDGGAWPDGLERPPHCRVTSLAELRRLLADRLGDGEARA